MHRSMTCVKENIDHTECLFLHVSHDDIFQLNSVNSSLSFFTLIVGYVRFVSLLDVNRTLFMFHRLMKTLFW
jgi:hypothetical protein